jgi:hypothetical protein
VIRSPVLAWSLIKPETRLLAYRSGFLRVAGFSVALGEADLQQFADDHAFPA